MKMRNFGILCPEVVTLKKNVLLMSFIGSEAQPAPKLKDVNLNEEQLKDAYQQIIQVNN
jgi:RIO kinase 3